MPELPEVEVLVRHLKPLISGKTIRAVRVFRPKVLLPTTVRELGKNLRGATFVGLERRGKYLVFDLKKTGRNSPVRLLGHLGMTGRIYLAKKSRPLPKHTAVVLDLGAELFVYEDTRYFGRLTLDNTPLERLGFEPLDRGFSSKHFARLLGRSSQPIKIKLLDQTLVAGVGNIYASEALFQAEIFPGLPASRLNMEQVRKLRRAIRKVLNHAIKFGSTVPLTYGGTARTDGLFYFGQEPGAPDLYEERLQVYDRAGRECPRCGSDIRRIVQAARSTFYCPSCQRR